LGWTEIGDFEVEPLLHLTIGVFGKTDRPGLRDVFSNGSSPADRQQVGTMADLADSETVNPGMSLTTRSGSLRDTSE
jgi:hypothetical protein